LFLPLQFFQHCQKKRRAPSGLEVIRDNQSISLIVVHGLFALAMKAGLTANQIKATMFAYPSYASDLGYMV